MRCFATPESLRLFLFVHLCVSPLTSPGKFSADVFPTTPRAISYVSRSCTCILRMCSRLVVTMDGMTSISPIFEFFFPPVLLLMMFVFVFMSTCSFDCCVVLEAVQHGLVPRSLALSLALCFWLLFVSSHAVCYVSELCVQSYIY